jgi:hypothetical protein
MPCVNQVKTDSGGAFVNFATVRSTVNRCGPRGVPPDGSDDGVRHRHRPLG